jgi:tRNA-Thr(GGU) m(6)t(6)A37 methyltransferase TsaA
MYDLDPIGFVRAARTTASDDFWGDTTATIELVAQFPPDSLAGLDEFSHVEVIYLFDRVSPSAIVTGARHPRDNPAWPKVGIFAQRGKGRPNRLAVSVARVLAVRGRVLTVGELDAIDGTPVLDLKPVMREFLPRGELHQPAWAGELMADYWTAGATRAGEAPE